MSVVQRFRNPGLELSSFISHKSTIKQYNYLSEKTPQGRTEAFARNWVSHVINMIIANEKS